ncbi:hypothetical protein ABH926_009969 [Catenulispora sp. GP43]
MAGCGGSSSKSNPGLNQTLPATTGATTGSSPTVTADVAGQAKADALNAYKGMVAATTREFAVDSADPDLTTYVYGTAFGFFNTLLQFRITNNIVYQGTPQSNPVVTDVKPDATPPTATITDCYGGPNYKPVFASDKAGHKKGDSALAPGTAIAAHPVTAVLEEKDGHWLVINYTQSAPGQTC